MLEIIAVYEKMLAGRLYGRIFERNANVRFFGRQYTVVYKR